MTNRHVFLECAAAAARSRHLLGRSEDGPEAAVALCLIDLARDRGRLLGPTDDDCDMGEMALRCVLRSPAKPIPVIRGAADLDGGDLFPDPDDADDEIVAGRRGDWLAALDSWVERGIRIRPGCWPADHVWVHRLVDFDAPKGVVGWLVPIDEPS